MNHIDYSSLKHTYSTHSIPLDDMAGITPLDRAPRIGDVVVAEVLSTGKHIAIEDRSGLNVHIFPGDRIVCTFGNRYATDQYEGYVPNAPVDECDLLSVGGVCGEVVSRHAAMGAPTRIRLLGAAADREGQPLNTRPYGLRQRRRGLADYESILVVGASMNSGKTTMVGTLARALTQAGFRVAAAKVTGTAAGKDGRFFMSCGAAPVVDFTHAGFPSTYMLEREELLDVYRTLVGRAGAESPDYVLIEIADGIFQRETRMLLETAEVRAGVDHVFFTANDSLSAECGARALRAYGLPLIATGGMLTQSPLATREAEEATGLPCLSIGRVMAGAAAELLGAARERLALLDRVA